MSETTMRITYDLKEKLERMKPKMYASSTYEVVEKVLQENEKLKARISDLEEERKREEERAAREDLHLGQELKRNFVEVQEELGLNAQQMTMFLLEVYQSQLNIPINAFLSYVQMKGEGARGT